LFDYSVVDNQSQRMFRSRLFSEIITCSCWTDYVVEPGSSTVDEGEAQIQIGRMIPLLQVALLITYVDSDPTQPTPLPQLSPNFLEGFSAHTRNFFMHPVHWCESWWQHVWAEHMLVPPKLWLKPSSTLGWITHIFNSSLRQQYYKK